MGLRALLYVVMMLLWVAQSAQAQIASQEAIKTTILSAWDDLFDKIVTVHSSHKREYSRSKDGAPFQVQRHEVAKYAYNQRGYSFFVDIQAGRNYNKLQLINEKYTAELKKSEGKDHWLLTEIKLGKKEYEERKKMAAFPWLMFLSGSVFLPDWIREDGFTITKDEWLQDDYRKVRRLYFGYRFPDKKPPNVLVSVKSGFIDFDPNHYYRVEGYEVNSNSLEVAFVERVNMKYAAIEDLPVLTETRSEVTEAKSGKTRVPSSRAQSVFDIKYNVDLADEEFTLSHYGLPEPRGVTWRKPTPIYIWFLLAGVVCVVLASLVRYKIRRKHPNASPQGKSS